VETFQGVDIVYSEGVGLEGNVIFSTYSVDVARSSKEPSTYLTWMQTKLLDLIHSSSASATSGGNRAARLQDAPVENVKIPSDLRTLPKDFKVIMPLEQ
jgi:hypothetical protein